VLHVCLSDVKHYNRPALSLDDHVKAANSNGKNLSSFASVLLMTDNVGVQSQAQNHPNGNISWATIERQRFGDLGAPSAANYNSHLPR